ncbi:ferredoxin--NADP reductase [Patescibacteria group bacterium]
MPEFQLTLKSKREIAHSTMEFVFEKPERFDYHPGQFATLVCDNPRYTDKKGNRRAMSFVSSPTQDDLIFGMRISETAFKRSMAEAEPGTKMSCIGPAGRFLMPEDESIELVFLAGGIGITPFISMMKYVADKNLPRKITLIYCNNTVKNTVYLNELKELDKQNPNITFVPTMTDEKNLEHDWGGRCGRIDENMIKAVVNDISKPTYMIVGPPGMVDAMVALLEKLNIPKEQVVIEKFT